MDKYLQDLNQKMSAIIDENKNHLSLIKTLDDVAALKVKLFGKNSQLVSYQKNIKDVPNELRAEFGKTVNETKSKLTQMVDEVEAKLLKEFKSQKLKDEKIDVTIPTDRQYIGSRHPLNIVKNEVIDIFSSLGFSVAQGPEVETDFYSFQALNIPKDHPARDAQDTFYISENIVLRPHTSPVQARVMQSQKPPIRILCPGRVYRVDNDATHSPVFHQIEGLVVDKRVTLCDLKGTLELFAKKMFNSDTKVRLRSSFFPFTEPSVEVDLSCMMCGGSGCSLCKGTGWIEVLGAGMVNERVFENCGIDSDVYTGFAFGMGIERIAMVKYGIPDIRMFYENDLRLLKRIR